VLWHLRVRGARDFRRAEGRLRQAQGRLTRTAPTGKLLPMQERRGFPRRFALRDQP
jgi:hypothetical protein